jgi:plasmid maintenance system antidote protein VapI
MEVKHVNKKSQNSKSSEVCRVIDTILLRNIGANVRERIKEVGAVQTELARAINISHQHLQFFLDGVRSIALDQYVNLAFLLDISPGKLLEVRHDSLDVLQSELTRLQKKLNDLCTLIQETTDVQEKFTAIKQMVAIKDELAAVDSRIKLLGLRNKMHGESS